MDITTLLTGLAALVLGLLVGWRLARGAAAARTAGLVVGRDAALADRDRLHAEREALAARAGAAEVEVGRVSAALTHERSRAEERLATLREGQSRLVEQFQVLSAEALETNSRRFLTLAETRLRESSVAATGELEQRRQAVETLVAPLRETLAKVESQLHELEQTRTAAYAGLVEQVGFARESSEQLRAQTSSLVTALRAPQTRGRWGEMQLRRVVEIAGMVEHCDFTEQAGALRDDALTRPDMVVHLSGGKHVVVDSKVTLSAYLEAAEATDDDRRAERLAAHARHLRNHVEALAAKTYWSAFPTSPEFVVLFVPGEAFLAPALEQDPTLLESAMGRRVVIATPTTLMTMLRTVSFAWQQAALTDNAREVFEAGKQLYARLGTLGEHVDKLGRSLNRAVTDYNSTVGSLETRVLVQARKLAELKVVDGPLDTPRPVEAQAKSLSAPVLLAAVHEARTVVALPAPARGVADDDADDAADVAATS